jgi:hypothetical protein
LGVSLDLSETERVLDATLRHWDLDGPLPRPKGEWVACPVCRSPDYLLKRYGFHPRPESELCRADVTLKCRECAAVWTHGVAIPELLFRQHGHVAYEREDIKEILHEGS